MELLIVQSDPFGGPGLMDAQWRLRGIGLRFAYVSRDETARRQAASVAFGEPLAHRFADQALLRGR